MFAVAGIYISSIIHSKARDTTQIDMNHYTNARRVDEQLTY